MKIYRIIAVTFLGILMYAFAKKCKLMPAAKDFNSEKYFNIPHVYVTHSRNGSETDVCREYNTTKIPDGNTVTVVFGDYKIGTTSYSETFQCTNREISGSQGQFSSVCSLPDESGRVNRVNYRTSIIATDNEKYVILQRCSQTTGSDNILVLQTNKDDLEQGVEDYFSTKNWTIEKWVSRTNVNCYDIKNEISKKKNVKKMY
uniref:Putative salivary lipocalin n=1 Tax=Panstrongylus lignarius TaxID=156445 RepID=A0A224XYF0_9HEMI